jgi:predicted RecA/RadA family phage recombinase
MAKAFVQGSITDIRTLKYTNASAVTAGDILVLNGNVTVAVATTAAAGTSAYVFRGRVAFPKEASLVVAPGEKLYYVTANGNGNKTSAGNTLVGIAVEAAAAPDATVLVELTNN